MEGHYTYLGALTGIGENEQEFFSGVAIAVLLVVLGVLATSRLKSDKGISDNIVPPKKINLFGFLDFFVESFIAFHDSILGKDNRKYVSFSGAIFIFLLASNMIGLVPGMAAITTTVWITVGMAIAVFIYFNFLGVKEQGGWHYIKHFTGGFGGLMALLGLLLFPVEIFSTTLRVLTLNLRLYWNINADHMVLGMFTELWQYGAFPLYVLGAFVSFMQAFIFTTLTMVYILLATQHEEDH